MAARSNGSNNSSSSKELEQLRSKLLSVKERRRAVARQDGAAEDPMRDFPFKENASVVGSSLTECKNDTDNCDGPESSINKRNEDCNPDTEELLHPSSDVGSTHVMEDKINTRYFVIKSLSYSNIQLSIENGIWATQVMNEPILDEAFHNSDRVILIFSVNMSGFFHGYAQMMSSVSWKRDNVWSKSGGGSNPWGRSFRVKWLQLCELPFQKTLHIKNPLNDYKPVKISRDCQELSADTGEALCGLFDSEVVDNRGKLKRNNSFVDDTLLKKPYRNSVFNFEGETNMHSELSAHSTWAGSVLHPSLFYQNVQHQENINAMLGGSPGITFHQNLHSYMDPKSCSSSKSCFAQKGQRNRQGDRNGFLESTRKDAVEPKLAESLTEEDFLSMTYEEYLQAVGDTSFSSCLPSASAGRARDCAGF